MSSSIVPTARPPDLATFTLLVNETALSPQLHLLSATVALEANRVPWARFVLRDGDPAQETFPVSASDTFLPGAKIEFKLGYHGAEETVFKGLLTRHGILAGGRRPPQLVIECRHAASQLTLTHQSRLFSGQTDSEIAETLLHPLRQGLAIEVEATTVQHTQMVQFAATDWDFLLLRARSNGQLVLPRPGGLAVKAPDFESAPPLTLAYGSSLEMFEGELEARLQPSSVTVRGWDPSALEATEDSADQAGESTAGNPDGASLAGAVGNPAQAAWHAGTLATDELQAWAGGSLLRQRAAKLRGRARCLGFSSAQPGDNVELAGLGARFNGRAWISGVRHEFSAGVWRTDFQLGLDPSWLTREAERTPTAAGLLPSPNGLQIGLVAGLAGDPDHGERILVRLPVTHPHGEGLWARLATIEAGDTRGFVFRPSIGDEVVVGFLNDDPRHPVVLGALHSGAHAAPIPAADANTEKGYLSHSKLKLSFREDEKSITLSTDQGNRIVLSEQDSSITIADQNGNKIVLSSAGITIESVKDLTLKAAAKGEVSALNLDLKASVQAKLEGSAQAELSSGGSTAVKGSIVQIN